VKLVAFRPNLWWDSTINFQQEIIFGKCSRNFLHTKALRFLDLRNFGLVSAILFWVHITLKSSENTYTTTFICHLYPDRETNPKGKHRKRYKEKNQDVLFTKKQVFQFCLLSVCDLLRLIPWVFRFEIFSRHFLLCVLRCGWDLSLKFVRRDSMNFYSSLPRLKGRFVSEWNYLTIL